MSTSEPLARPMGIGDLLDRAISLYRNNFLTLVGVVAIIQIPLLLLQIIATVLTLPTDFASLSRASSVAGFSLTTLIYYILIGIIAMVSAIAAIFQQGAIAQAASEFFLGKRAGIKQSYGRAFRRGWALFGAAILIGLVNVLIFGALLLPFLGLVFETSARGGSSSTASAALGILALCVCAAFLPALVLASILNIHWILWPQAVIIESKGVRSGLGRSWRLVRGSFWRVFLIVAVMYAFILVITLTPVYAISFASLMFPSVMLASVLNTTVSVVINIFVTPLTYTILTLLYYDLRIRKEGFDLELRARQLAQEASAP